MKKPKIFKGTVFELKLHQITKHASAANITISTVDDSIKNVSSYWIDDLIKLLNQAKQELEKNHQFEIVEDEKYYSMQERLKVLK